MNELQAHLSKMSSASSTSFKEYSPLLSSKQLVNESSKQLVMDKQSKLGFKRKSSIIAAKLYNQTKPVERSRQGIKFKT